MANAYVIIGGSLTGATAAATLREEGADGSVTLIGAERELPYERPPLSKAFLRGEVAFDQSLVRPAAFYAAHRIETLSGIRATRIDVSARVVELEDRRRLPFDRLLIATGGRNRRLSIPGSELEGIYTLRTVDDAVRIKAEISPGRRVVVVGMGFIGSEVAASLRQKDLDVVAIEPAKTPLFRVLGEDIGQVPSAWRGSSRTVACAWSATSWWPGLVSSPPWTSSPALAFTWTTGWSWTSTARRV